ncbi:hypothetical protein DIRU0_C26016 [Diutina rugosa]
MLSFWRTNAFYSEAGPLLSLVHFIQVRDNFLGCFKARIDGTILLFASADCAGSLFQSVRSRCVMYDKFACPP